MRHHSIMPRTPQWRCVDMQIADNASKFEMLLAAHNGAGMPALILHGCWDAFSAELIGRAGHQAAWLGRSAVARARLGRDAPDLVTMATMVAIMSDIRDASDLAIAVDAGNGFGNAFNVGRTLTTLDRAGAEAIQLADEIAFAGFEDTQRATVDMIGKVKAAVDAGTDLVLIARTARLPNEGLSELMDRASAYAEAGADLVGIDDSIGTPDLSRLAGWASSRVPLLLETNAASDPVRMGGTAIICLPTRFQSTAIEALQPLLPPPAVAPIQPSAELIRSLAS